jgi:hypothetical protein
MNDPGVRGKNDVNNDVEEQSINRSVELCQMDVRTCPRAALASLRNRPTLTHSALL